MTAAESFVRELFQDYGSREAELGVLALERAIVRGGYEFVAVSKDWDGEDVPAILGSALVDDHVSPEPLLPGLRNSCQHVADWIVASCLNEAPWLKRLDRDGLPVKLTKMGSVERAVAEADKAMRRFGRQVPLIALCGKDEIVHAELGDGWSIVRLLTPESLDRESALMQHCIGQGAYDGRLLDGSTTFLSLRDPKGQPHATIELRAVTHFGDKVLQLQGKQNERPIERHLRRLRPWLKANVRVDVGKIGVDTAFEWWSGLVRSQRGGAVDLYDPPASAELKDPVVFHLLEGDVLPTELLSTPAKITISIDPSRRSPVVLPASIFCKSDLLLKGPGTFVCGALIHANGLLTQDCRIENVPVDLVIDRRALFQNSVVDLLPAGVSMRDIEMPGSHVRFAEGFDAESVSLKGSLVDALPSGFSTSELHVEDCPLKEIPDGTRISSLAIIGPDLLRMGRIEGLTYIDMRNASPDLEMPRELKLDSMMIGGIGFPSSLPERLVVAREMHLDRTRGIVLPSDLDVGRMTVVDRCFEAIPDGTRIRGLLQLIDAGQIEIGSGCEIDQVVVIEAADAKEDGRKPGMKSFDFDPQTARIDGDGTCTMRDPSLQMP